MPPMDDLYTSETDISNEFLHEDHDLFEQHVVQGDDDILLMHHFLNEVFRESRGSEK